jgi:hypothetical protein
MRRNVPRRVSDRMKMATDHSTVADATRTFTPVDRGLKPTATFKLSLRDTDKLPPTSASGWDVVKQLSRALAQGLSAKAQRNILDIYLAKAGSLLCPCPLAKASGN